MGVSGEHRLNTVTHDLCQISIIHTSSAEVSHVAMAALVGADV